ncbi:MAG: oxygen-independent coproporphyrinogen III oxidase [Hyphomicrobiaceae bacterium]
MQPALIEKYAAPVPRYTSYPTAPHFTPAVDAATYAAWLSELPVADALSLYLHVPFCDTLCWYCGCSTKATQRYEPVAAYVDNLLREVETVASHLPARMKVAHVHWGGGSPNVLNPADIRRVGGALRSAFEFRPDVEFAVEIDPRELSPEQADSFAAIGVSRLSVGVQDFDEAVQVAINRLQSFETTSRAMELFRSRGVQSVNVDLVYGLPYQTVASVERTIRQVIELGPDRIALFGYAHLPSRFAHQRLIPDESLPGPVARFAQSTRLADILGEAGYVRIGLDHFAKQSDHLATRTLRRNFQGYTTDAAGALLGFGATAIGKLPQGFVQNAVATADYKRRIDAGELATVRGRALTRDDRVRAYVIERLMCDLTFSAPVLRAEFGAAADAVIAEAEALVESDVDGLITASADGFTLTEDGRPFIRTLCATFDTYLSGGTARHSSGV